MKKLWIVLKYELKEYFSNKPFLIMTVALAILGAAAMFLPRFFDLSDFTGVQVTQREPETSTQGERELYLYLDEAGILEKEALTAVFPDADWQPVESREEMEALMSGGELSEAGLEETSRTETEDQDAAGQGRVPQAGFVITGETSYEYYVYNKSMNDGNMVMFDQVMGLLYRSRRCAEQGWNLEEIQAMYDVPISVTEQVLNKDSGENFWYCYVLVITVFVMITMYGQMIAVAVTNEKSNRAIEVLVTSTTPNSLLFGKVIAGAVGGVFQVGLILGALLCSYQWNRQIWGGQLDRFLHVPAEVLAAFAVFGLGGYLFYAFLYGAMGALVSKTEDVSKSVGGLMVAVMAVYFVSLIQLTNVDGPVIKVLSFLPFSSYSTMFARIAMGTVAPWEIILSAAILFASIMGVGVVGARIYRMGTLRYGNPIRLTSALKEIRRDK